jgi:hypothetical protein
MGAIEAKLNAPVIPSSANLLPLSDYGACGGVIMDESLQF